MGLMSIIEARELWVESPSDYSRKFIVETDDVQVAVIAAKTKTRPGMLFVEADAQRISFALCEVRVQYKRATQITDAFRELAEASGGRWDNVDPEAFVREQRGC
jgi:hypothetical protein